MSTDEWSRAKRPVSAALIWWALNHHQL